MKKKLLAMLVFMVFGTVNAQDKFTAYFDFDIDEANVPSSQRLSAWINNHPDVEVTKIHAYADTIGHPLYNVDLSERRARYVLQQLRGHKVPVAGNVEVQAFGESRSATGKPAERRAIIYYKKKQPLQPAGLSEKVKAAKVGDKLILPSLNFYNYSDVVLPQSEKVLWELLEIMRGHKDLKIEIQGHICCEVLETDEISLKRAKAVYNFLLRGGIDKSRLSYRSFGSSHPLYPLPEKDEAERIANRRVEIEILDKALAAE